MSGININTLLTIGNGIVPPLTVTKGSDNIFNVDIMECDPGCLTLNYIVKQVDNLVVSCKQHMDDTSYVFKLSLREEHEKPQPKILKIEHPTVDISCSYCIYMDRDVLKNVNPGKYWWGIGIEVNGSKQVFSPNVLTINADITDVSGGQIINATPLINIDDVEL